MRFKNALFRIARGPRLNGLRSRRLFVIAVVLIGAAALVGHTVVTRAHTVTPIARTVSSNTRLEPPPRESKPPSRTTGQASSAPIQGEVITIGKYGFSPQTLTRPKGPFYLIVQDRSGLPQIELRVDRVAGARLTDVPLPRNRFDWTNMFDLTPGEYVLTEVNNPSWSCQITITP